MGWMGFICILSTAITKPAQQEKRLASRAGQGVIHREEGVLDSTVLREEVAGYTSSLTARPRQGE